MMCIDGGVGGCSEEGEPEAETEYDVHCARALTHKLDALCLHSFSLCLNNSQTPSVITTR